MTSDVCVGCQQRATITAYVLEGDQVMCDACVDSEGLHGQLWPSCTEAWHQPLDHLVDIRFKGASAL